MSVKVIIRKPKKMIRQEEEKKSLDSIWAEVCSWVIENPKSTDSDLYNIFGSRSGIYGISSFIQALQLRGISAIRKSLKKGRTVKQKDSIQLTEEVVQSFEKERRRKGMIHLGKMDTVVNGVQKMLHAESEKLQSLEYAGPLLGAHIDNASKAHKLAKDVYNIDGGNEGNTMKMNIAIITNFDPSQTSGEVIDV